MHKLTVFLLCLLVILVYSRALGNGFILDDETLILNNPVIRNTNSVSSLFNLSLYDSPKTYRPMQVLSYMIDYKIWGLNAFGFHLSNIILHSLNCILIYFILAALSTAGIGFAAGALFAVHPINASVVAYISGRADILAVLFMLLSILFFLKFSKINSLIYYSASLLCACLSFFCRENAMLLPLFILLISPAKLKKIRYILPFFVSVLLYISLRFALFGNNAAELHFFSLPLYLSIINFLYIILKYLQAIILPVNLHLFRAVPFITGVYDTRVLFAVSFAILFILFLLKFRENKVIILAALWFLCGLIPVFFLFNAYPWLKQAMMSENWLYLPAMGIFILAAVIKERAAKAGSLLFSAAVLSFACLTYQGNANWKDNISVYKNTLKYLPERNPVRVNLIKEYLARGMYNNASVELEKLTRAFPANSEVLALEKQLREAKGKYNGN